MEVNKTCKYPKEYLFKIYVYRYEDSEIQNFESACFNKCVRKKQKQFYIALLPEFKNKCLRFNSKNKQC